METQKKNPLSIKEVCKLLNISRPHLYSLTKQGSIRAYKLGAKTMFLEEEVWEDFKKNRAFPSASSPFSERIFPGKRKFQIL